jgi:alanyl-tRNA synthetase
MTSTEIRQSFLDFFREKQHTIVPSSSLLPDAPNLLFTNAGMNQFVPIFLGQQKPAWNPPRVADTQKCIRAGGKHNDLEDVGFDTYHHTFFEMLGNWSFGDYFKKEAIEWAWELLVDRWKFPAQRLYATVLCPHMNQELWFDELDAMLANVHSGTIVDGDKYRHHFLNELVTKKPAFAGLLRENSDMESAQFWARAFIAADLDPKRHIIPGSKEDNLWMMGDTGPYGPCSEIHVDLTPDGDTRGALVNKEDSRCIEIWNLVFIQYNANPDNSFTPLPQRHVDTGMGFERVTAMIQGTRNLTDFSGTVSNYETDVFRPIFDELENLSGKKYASTLPETGQSAIRDPRSKTDVAFRVIADHIRALSFAIADGIIPSNEGRGYVLRRILRRAVRYGRTLSFHEPFFFKLVDVVAKTMGDVFAEVRTNQSRIKETIKREEETFNRTLDLGMSLFQKAVDLVESSPAILKDDSSVPADYGAREYERDASGERTVFHYGRFQRDEHGHVRKRISGEVAFKLYDTYGFPLDLTELLARERGFTVDVAEFEKLMEQQRARGRGAQKKIKLSADLAFASELEAKKISPTKFLGYDFLEAESVVKTVLPGKETEDLNVVLDQTPFYAEMGGQVGDRGLLHVPGHDRTEVGQLRVIDTQKRGHVFVHRAKLVEGRAPEPGEAVRVAVDVDRRKSIQGHHTVTHLLHWALHEIVSRDAAQKGSYVGSDKLTFDFSSAALTRQQVRDVEKLVNDKITENAPVSWTEVPYAEARKRKDIIQFFGEKYGDTVRVLQIGGEPNSLNGYSMELCGGTHVRATSEIGPFRIVKEEAIAAGIRRIEAVAGDAARAWAEEEAARQHEKFEMLARKKSDVSALPTFAREAETAEMLTQIDARAAQLEKIDLDVREWEKKNAKSAEAEVRSRAAQIANELAASYTGKKFCVAEVPSADGKLLQAIVDGLKPKFNGPIFLAGEKDGNVALIASVPKELTAKFQANKLIQQIAPIVGGKGGGRPENAQGAGKDVSKIEMALAKAMELLR